VSFAAGSYPRSVAVADVNGDGHPDLAAADSGSNYVTVLHGNGDGTFGPATHLGVSAPTGSTAGVGFPITVTALTTDNQRDTSYTGTVHFTSSDAKAVLPADYTFTSADAGSHTFTVTLKTAGGRTVTATDRADGSVTASATVSVKAASVNHFAVVASTATPTAGVPFQLTVKALDAYGNVVTGYRGAVHFTSSDPAAVLPADYTFTAGDKGKHTFTVTLNTVGPQTVTAAGKANPKIKGTAKVTVLAPAGGVPGDLLSPVLADLDRDLLDYFYGTAASGDPGVMIGGR
jgi:hypothetical protein